MSTRRPDERALESRQDRSGKASVDRFLTEVSTAQTPSVRSTHRLLFGIDATASRQPTWDLACELHAELFAEAARAGNLAIQLCYYRGLNEFVASQWATTPDHLREQMLSVSCRGGRTQLRRLLEHALNEATRYPVRALIFIGDCFEEDEADVLRFAGQLAIRALPVFVFQEGTNRTRHQSLQVDRAIDQRRARAVRCLESRAVETPSRCRGAIRIRRAIGVGRVRATHRQRRNSRAAEPAETSMMLIALGGLVAAFVIGLLLRSLWVRAGLNVRQTVITLGVAAVLIAIVALTVTGRLNWIVAVLAAMIPLVRRLGAFVRMIPWLAALFPKTALSGRIYFKTELRSGQHHHRKRLLPNDAASRLRSSGWRDQTGRL